MKGFFQGLGIFTALCVVGLLALGWIAGPDQAVQRQVRRAAWIDQGEAAVRHELKAPASASFRDVRFYSGQLPAVCGQVNADNSLGGRAGFQRFVSLGSPGKTYLEEQVSDFPALWGRLCVN